MILQASKTAEHVKHVKQFHHERLLAGSHWLASENLDHSATLWGTIKHYKISCTPHHISSLDISFGCNLGHIILSLPSDLHSHPHIFLSNCHWIKSWSPHVLVFKNIH